jgi:23S rRNA (adenine2503-C2)-methyltransferase
MSAPPLAGLSGEQFLALAREEVGRGHGLSADLYRDWFRKGRFDPGLYCGTRRIAAWRALVDRALPSVEHQVGEANEYGQRTTKAVLRAADGAAFECVHLPMGRDRHTLCLSSQVGCRMGCAFCETATLGLRRQLSAAEIVSQVLVARHRLNWPVGNLVFMGMGEALDNAEALIQALLVLSDKRGLSYGHEHITVCTVGHAEGIERLKSLGWKRLNLSLSLNVADDARRRQLMPVTRRWPLAELQAVLADYPQRASFVLGINVCLMPGINDSRDDSRAIADFCRPLGRVLINLIPYNPGSRPLCPAPEEAEIVRFIDWLREDGLPVRRRITKGRSVMAACGQLGKAAMAR